MKRLKLRLIFILTLGFILTTYAQFDVPEKPNVQTSVYDYINLFSKNEKQYFENKLVKYSDTTSTQIVVITIATTNGENINYLGANWGEKWGIGQATEDNGIVILLAQDDRRIAINTGYGIEHLLTDALSKRIIEQDIIPFFKRGNYIEGLDRGVDAIFKVLTGVYQNKKSNASEIPLKFVFIVIIIVLIIVFLVFRNNGGKKNGSGSFKDLSNRDILEAIILSNSGRRSYRKGSGGFGGWNTGSSSSGGFSGGFGGGGFGGGGASGGW